MSDKITDDPESLDSPFNACMFRGMCIRLRNENATLKDELLMCRSKLAIAAENSAGDDERIADLQSGLTEANLRWIAANEQLCGARSGQLDTTLALMRAGVTSFGSNAQGVEKLAAQLAERTRQDEARARETAEAVEWARKREQESAPPPRD